MRKYGPTRVRAGRAMNRTVTNITGMAVLLTVALARAEAPRTIVPNDYFSLAAINECRLSPDGRHVAYTETRWEPPAELRNTDLWVINCETRHARRLTFDRANDAHPVWSPSGKTIYFSAARELPGSSEPPYDGTMQIWSVSVDGGSPRAVTRVKDGISGFRLAMDGNSIYYTRSTEQTDDDPFAGLRSKYDSIDFATGSRSVHTLWRLDLQSWRAEQLVDEKRFIRSFAVSPDERWIAMITGPDARLITHEGRSRVDLFDVEQRTHHTLPDRLWREEAPSPNGWLESLAWSSDSAALAFTVMFDGYPTEVLVAERLGSSPTVQRLTRPAGAFVQGGLTWRPGTRDLCFVAAHQARTRVLSVRDVRDGRHGTSDVLTPGDVVVSAYSFSRQKEGPVAVVLATPTSPGDLYQMSRETREIKASFPYRRLTEVNPQVAEWKLPQISLMEWKSRDGRTVQGVLELPPDYKPADGPLPTVIELHGGPTSATTYSLRFWVYGRTLFAAQGYALLSPNYRGSTGYGDQFLIDLIGNENDIDVADILTGVDALIERGIADPQRLGVMGWSNGGFLTNCVITQDSRFKAASSGAGVVDQFMQWGEEDTPGHVFNYMRGLPWEQAAAYMSASPAYALDKVKAATLIHVGANDPRVPAVHARSLHRALREYVGVPTELLTYPGQGHSLNTYTYRKAKMEWDLAWFDHYLRDKSPDDEQ